MKKLLLAAGAAFGVYMIIKSLNAKKENGFDENKVAVADGGISSGGNITNSLSDEGDWANNEKLPNETDDKEILTDGGNEMGGTGGSAESSVGEGI